MRTTHHPLETAFSRAWLTDKWSDVTTLAAVSGGPDSVALLRALLNARPADAAGRIVVGHYNHGWRGMESDADEGFVRQLAVAHQLEFVGQSSALSPDGERLPSEESARDERYAFLLETAHHIGARYIALGHTADDQAETILFRMLRGTGLSGLTGMPLTRPLSEAVTLVRPLLLVRRAQVLDYLQSLGQTYRVDASNSDVRFSRNRLRHEVLPKVQEVSQGDVVEQLLQLGQQAADLLEPIRCEAKRLLDAAAANEGDSIVLHLGRAGSPSRHVVREMFVELWRRQHWPRGEMTFERWDELAEAYCEQRSPKGMFPGGLRVVANANQLRVSVGERLRE